MGNFPRTPHTAQREEVREFKIVEVKKKKKKGNERKRIRAMGSRREKLPSETKKT